MSMLLSKGEQAFHSFFFFIETSRNAEREKNKGDTGDKVPRPTGTHVVPEAGVLTKTTLYHYFIVIFLTAHV